MRPQFGSINQSIKVKAYEARAASRSLTIDLYQSSDIISFAVAILIL